MSSYVDLMGDVRWTERDHVERVEAEVRSSVTHVREHVILRRTIALIFYILAQVLPAGPLKTMVASFGRALSPAALTELTAAAAVFLVADDTAVQARLDSARLDLALDYEQTQRALLALPPVPEAGPDPDAQRRAELQALLDAASEDTLELVAQRAAVHAPTQPAPVPAPAPAP